MMSPEQYETRFDRISREGYLRDHWRPLNTMMINKYCRDEIVLDLGCGPGSFSGALALENAKFCIGLDMSRDMLSYAKCKYENLNACLADAHYIPLKPESMSVVLCLGLLEYVDRAVVLKEITRVLKPDGICMIGCPNKYSASRMPYKITANILRRERNCDEPSFGEVCKLLQINNLEVIETKMDDGLIWLPDFLDKLVGIRIYAFVEKFFAVFGKNPFSSMMFFLARKPNIS